ncbi:MAG TPA: SusD/RagB family nutrient-binding outer membrane lipoprotein, partial [Gemmatimonadaceae bacterium]|nr:SusD/RagB family nutrient-binding outer membrane lipoprotein [Gemmatimonadaceae bacterium]
MRKTRIIASAGLAGAALMGACTNFLNSDKAVQNPNNPTTATTAQLFVGVQANIFGEQEGPVAMIICEWMQQCAGVNGRFVDQQGVYSISAGSFDGSFQSIYTGGGLLQIKQVEKQADAAGDKVTKGMAEVLEAMNMMFGADIWGDLPYSEAAGTNTTPKFDPQMTVYGNLLTLLTNAIADLKGAGGPNPADDLIYGGSTTKWIEAAHTLRARIYLHRVEKLGNGEYTNALAEAQLGISKPADDFKSAHNGATSERNMWAQFQTSSFGNDLVAGSILVDLMTAQGDPRLPDYFGLNPKKTYGGYNVTTQATAVADISPILGSGRTDDDAFSQPIITYDENQLILAEASFKLTGAAAAAPFLNTVRAEYGKAAIATPTLADIMNEKYIALFQNIETWNDYKRTCLPVMHP